MKTVIDEIESSEIYCESCGEKLPVTYKDLDYGRNWVICDVCGYINVIMKE